MDAYIDYILIAVMAVLLIAVIIMLYFNRQWVKHEKETDTRNRAQLQRLGNILQSGRLQLWTYEKSTRLYSIISEKGAYTHEYTPIDFSQFFDRDDFENLRSNIFAICEGEWENCTLRIRSNPANKGELHHYDITLSVVDRDNNGHAKMLLGVQRDVTDMLKREQEVSQLLMRYHTVFNSALSDMIFYDKDGRLTDINDKACNSFSINDKRGLLYSDLQLKDNPLLNWMDFSHFENIRTTAIIDQKDLEKGGYIVHGWEHSPKFYYESSINPITDLNGELEGTYVSGRNVTEMVESVHRQQEGLQKLRKIHTNIQKYIRNINYALRVSDVRLVNYYPDTFTFEISNNINQTQLTLSQVRCIRLASPRFRKDVSITLNLMDHKKAKNIEKTIEINLHDQLGRPIWLMFNMVPVYNAQGQVERYFGMCRNMTEMMETERRLAIETKKAQETENLKQSFLTNMSYEIRTPLNTVVGFAELFEAEHDPADEAVFVEEIKNNSNKLLALVNDILFLSRLDANMIESHCSDTDFALFFEGCCQLGFSNVSPEVKTVVENDYEHLIVNIDLDNVGKVIQRTCLIAGFYTKQGTIRARYEYWHGELIISIEDTGVGIDSDKLALLFDRFRHSESENQLGTGLDLPIIQALTRMMGGDVEVQSEKGKGSTVRITIPCEAIQIEKKHEVIND